MNILWQEKLKELSELDKEQAWYIVKHNPDIVKLCYYVSFLEEFQKNENLRQEFNLQNYIDKRVADLNSEKGWTIVSNYRTLMVASYYGLILKTAQKGDKYDSAPITETFQEIKNRCNGQFENTESYNDIIQRQIEKIFITSPFDDEFQGRRKEYKLFPVMYLYKILLELGKSTGKYSISILVYNTLILTSHKYQDFLESLLLIKLLDTEKEAFGKLKNEIGSKFSTESRWNRTLELLDTLDVTSESITLKSEYIKDVARKVYLFENNELTFNENNYLQFLGSTQSLVVDKIEQNTPSDKLTTTSSYKNSWSQLILYGVPGSGKSYTIKNLLAQNNISAENTMRVVFHPEYTNSDFIGQILPRSDASGSTISYPFVPGPFTQLLALAYTHKNKNFALIIEEINRGNAAAIFGELFQLLDRLDKDEEGSSNGYKYTSGWSSYPVTNDSINHAIFEAYMPKADDMDFAPFIPKENFEQYKENIGIRLPPNFSIFATMNTSDQNVFKLDNAFKRRFDLELIPNIFGDENGKLTAEEENQRDAEIEGFGFTWNNFREAVNEIITKPENEFDISSFSDRQIGCWFVKAEEKSEKDTDIKSELKIPRKTFLNKVLEYLWDDVCNGESEIFFNSDYKTLAELINAVQKKHKTDIFSKDLQEKILRHAQNDRARQNDGHVEQSETSQSE